MQTRIFIGHYTKEERAEVLSQYGYRGYIEFDGETAKRTLTEANLSQSDLMLYHLTEFKKVLDKKDAKDDGRPIVIANAFEYLDDAFDNYEWVDKLKKHGRDVFIFTTKKTSLWGGKTRLIVYKEE